MMLNNMLKNYKVFQERLIGLKLKLSMKVLNESSNRTKTFKKNFNSAEDNSPSEEPLVFKPSMIKKYRCGKMNLEIEDLPSLKTNSDHRILILKNIVSLTHSTCLFF